MYQPSFFHGDSSTFVEAVGNLRATLVEAHRENSRLLLQLQISAWLTLIRKNDVLPLLEYGIQHKFKVSFFDVKNFRILTWVKCDI